MRARILTTERGLGDCADVERKAWTFARRELTAFNPSRETLGEFFRYCCDLLCLDPVAFERLMLDHGSKVAPVVSKRAVSRPERDYDDIAQEVWLEVLEKLPNFDPHKGSIDVFISNIRTWHIKRSYPTQLRLTTPSADALHLAQDDESPSVLEPSVADPEPATAQAGFHPPEETPDPAPTASEAASRRELQMAKYVSLKSYIRTIFADCAQPHQNIAFGLVQMIRRKPGVLVERHWRESLDGLVEVLETGLLNEYGEEKDGDGSTLAMGFAQTDVRRMLAPLREGLVKMKCCNLSFRHYVPDDDLDCPGDKLLSLARKEFIDYEIAGRTRRKEIEPTRESKAAAEREIEKEWGEMSPPEKDVWCGQVRANFLSRWVNNVSRRSAVKEALAKLKSELARIAAAERDGRPK